MYSSINIQHFNLGASLILIVEVIVMRNRIKAVVQAGFANIHTNGDNKTLIQAVQCCIKAPWEIQVLIQGIIIYIQLCNKVFIDHIFRQGNCVSDWLVKFGLSLHSMIVWNVVPQMDRLFIFYKNNLVRAFERRVV